MLGGELEALWDYGQDEEEWSDEYRLGPLEVTVSSFLVSTIDRFVDEVVLRTDTDPVRHMRVAALHRSRPLHGPELISSWRARVAVYPDKLMAAVVERSGGSPCNFPGHARWRAPMFTGCVSVQRPSPVATSRRVLARGGGVGRFAAPGQEEQMRQHQRVRITQVLTYRLVHLIELMLGGDARRQDLGAHAAHQVRPDGAA